MAMAMPTAEKVYGEMLMRARAQELARPATTAPDMIISDVNFENRAVYRKQQALI